MTSQAIAVYTSLCTELYDEVKLVPAIGHGFSSYRQGSSPQRSFPHLPRLATGLLAPDSFLRKAARRHIGAKGEFSVVLPLSNLHHN